MEIGCGARVRTLAGHRYVYFWHYDRVGGRSVRREEYLGPVDNPRTRERLLRRMAAYHGRAVAEFASRRARLERLVASGFAST